MKPELISFDLCPFVQRSVITLLEKQAEFNVTYIDLADPPQWFLDISPFGKVPALRVGDETLFESAVINEYLDEIFPPSMHPGDPLQKAINKAWIEFASEMLMTQYQYSVAKTEEGYLQSLDKLKHLISQLEAKLGDGPFFNGNSFNLIDAAYAPFFTRAAILESKIDKQLITNAAKVKQWSEKLVTRDSVISSVKTNFAEKYMDYIVNSNTYAGDAFKKT